MVRLLQLGALGLALCGVSNALALPQDETDSVASKPGGPPPPPCKKPTKRREWYVSPPRLSWNKADIPRPTGAPSPAPTRSPTKTPSAAS